MVKLLFQQSMLIITDNVTRPSQRALGSHLETVPSLPSPIHSLCQVQVWISKLTHVNQFNIHRISYLGLGHKLNGLRQVNTGTASYLPLS